MNILSEQSFQFAYCGGLMFDPSVTFGNIKLQILQTSSLFQTEGLDCIKSK